MRTRVGVLIIDGERRILLIHRWNEDREYFVVPGGGQETGESLTETAVREAKEETNLDVTISEPPVIEFNLEDDGYGHHQHNVYFESRVFSGEVEFGVAGPERELQSASNRYLLEWTHLSKLSELPIKPEQLKAKLIAQY